MAGNPIKLGTAQNSVLIFEAGSRVSTSDSGIQSCSVQAICPDGANVFSLIPPAGQTFNNVFGNNYLPSNFKVDYTGGGAEIEYLEGKAARVTITFKRPDPNQPTGRVGAKISVDSAINYKSVLDSYAPIPFQQSASGDPQTIFGFPEPIVYVRYNSATAPHIAGGTLGALYAKPEDPRAAGFPSLDDIFVPVDFTAPAGATVTYWNGTAFITEGPLTVTTVYHFKLVFSPNQLGWKLDKLKWDPQADSSFFDVEENWRGQYFFSGTQFLNRGPA